MKDQVNDGKLRCSDDAQHHLEAGMVNYKVLSPAPSLIYLKSAVIYIQPQHKNTIEDGSAHTHINTHWFHVSYIVAGSQTGTWGNWPRHFICWLQDKLPSDITTEVREDVALMPWMAISST